MARFQEGTQNLRIEGVSTPAGDNDAVNKSYLDTLSEASGFQLSARSASDIGVTVHTIDVGGGEIVLNGLHTFPRGTLIEFSPDENFANVRAVVLRTGTLSHVNGRTSIFFAVVSGSANLIAVNDHVFEDGVAIVRITTVILGDNLTSSVTGGELTLNAVDAPDQAPGIEVWPTTFVADFALSAGSFWTFEGNLYEYIVTLDTTVSSGAFVELTPSDTSAFWIRQVEGNVVATLPTILTLAEVQTEIGESFAIDGSRFAFNGRGFEATIQGGPTTMTFGATTRTITGFTFTRAFDQGDILLFRVKTGPFKGQSYDHTVPAGGHLQTETEITHLNSLFRDTSDGASIPTDGDVVVGDWYYADPEAWTLIATGDTLDDLTLTLNSGTSNFIVRRDPNGDLAPITTSSHTIQRTTTGNAELDLVSLADDGTLFEGSVFLERGTGLITFEDALRGGQTFGDKADTDLNNVSSTISHFDQNAIVQKIGAGVVHTEIGAPLFNGQELGGDFNHLAVNGTAWTLNFTDPDEADAAEHFLNPLLNGIGPNRAAVNAELIESITRVGNSFNLVMENAITLPASTDDGAGFFVFSVDQERIRRIDGGTYLDGVLTIDDSTTTTVQELPPADPELGQGWVDLDTGQEYTFFGGAWTQTGGYRQDSGITGITGQGVSDQQLIDIDTIPALTTEVEDNTAEIATKQDTLTDYTPAIWTAKQDALTDYTPLVWDAKADLTLSNLTDTTTAEQDAIRANIGYAVPIEGFVPVSWDDIHGASQTLGSLSDVNDGAVFDPGTADADLSLAFNGSNFETQAITSRAMRMEILVDGTDQPDATLFTTGVLQDGSHVLIRFNDTANTRVDFIVSQVEDFRTRTPATFHVTFLATTSLPIPASYVLGQFPTPFVTEILPLVRDTTANELLVRSNIDGQWDAVAVSSLLPAEGTPPVSWDTILEEAVNFQRTPPVFAYTTIAGSRPTSTVTVNTSNVQVINMTGSGLTGLDTFLAGGGIRFTNNGGDTITGIILERTAADAVTFTADFTILWDFEVLNNIMIQITRSAQSGIATTAAELEAVTTIEVLHPNATFSGGTLRLNDNSVLTRSESFSTSSSVLTFEGITSQGLAGFAGSSTTFRTSAENISEFNAAGFNIGGIIQIDTMDGLQWHTIERAALGLVITNRVAFTIAAPISSIQQFYTQGQNFNTIFTNEGTLQTLTNRANFVGFHTVEDTTNDATTIKLFEDAWDMRTVGDGYLVFRAGGRDVMSIDIEGQLRTIGGAVETGSTNLTPDLGL